MNEKRTLTLRAKIGQEWVLKQLETIAKDKQRSLNFIVLEILEKHVKKTKK